MEEAAFAFAEVGMVDEDKDAWFSFRKRDALGFRRREVDGFELIV